MTTLTISALGHRGDGIAEHEGRRVFAPFALPGETVEADIDGDRATLTAVLEPSPDRVAPLSRYFGTCGGCALQHMAPDAYRDFKRGLVVVALSQAGIETTVAPLVDATGEGRRRAMREA